MEFYRIVTRLLWKLSSGRFSFVSSAKSTIDPISSVSLLLSGPSVFQIESKTGEKAHMHVSLVRPAANKAEPIAWPRAERGEWKENVTKRMDIIGLFAARRDSLTFRTHTHPRKFRPPKISMNLKSHRLHRYHFSACLRCCPNELWLSQNLWPTTLLRRAAFACRCRCHCSD